DNIEQEKSKFKKFFKKLLKKNEEKKDIEKNFWNQTEKENDYSPYSVNINKDSFKSLLIQTEDEKQSGFDCLEISEYLNKRLKSILGFLDTHIGSYYNMYYDDKKYFKENNIFDLQEHRSKSRLFHPDRIPTNQSESISFVTITQNLFDNSPTYEKAIVQQDNNSIQLLRQTVLDYETRLDNYQRNVVNYEQRINSLENINQTLIKNIKELKETIAEVNIKIDLWNQNVNRIQKFVFEYFEEQKIYKN
ncbi:3953_t:CDS:2, partial [Gigaspora margarita]